MEMMSDYLEELALMKLHSNRAYAMSKLPEIEQLIDEMSAYISDFFWCNQGCIIPPEDEIIVHFEDYPEKAFEFNDRLPDGISTRVFDGCCCIEFY